MIKYLVKTGFKAIRIPVTWHNHLIDDKYTIDPKWMKRVKTVVDWCIDNGLYVILNTHHDNAPASIFPVKYGQGYYPLNNPQNYNPNPENYYNNPQNYNNNPQIPQTYPQGQGVYPPSPIPNYQPSIENSPNSTVPSNHPIMQMEKLSPNFFGIEYLYVPAQWPNHT